MLLNKFSFKSIFPNIIRNKEELPNITEEEFEAAIKGMKHLGKTSGKDGSVSETIKLGGKRVIP